MPKNKRAQNCSWNLFQWYFCSIQSIQGVRLPQVPQTQYLYAKLEDGPEPSPSFKASGFRSLEDPSQETQEDWANAQGPFMLELAQDEEVGASISELVRLHRVIAELEAAREMLRQFQCGAPDVP